jgi:dipeptidyl aminopeptidase/acylaminoacyl peptidase
MRAGTCEDISALLDHLRDDPRVDTGRAGITGISQGGFVSFLAITMDKRIKAAAPIIGSPDLECRFGSSRPFEEHSAEVQELVRRYSPLRNFERMPPAALFIQNGADDEVVPVSGVRKLHEKLHPLYAGMPDRYAYREYPGVGHSDTGMREPAIAWLQRHLTFNSRKTEGRSPA